MSTINRPKILFIPSVGKKYGIGNFLRCITLSRELEAQAEARFLLPDSFVEPLLTQEIDIVRFNTIDIDAAVRGCNAVVFDHQGPVDAHETFAVIQSISPGIPLIALDYFFLDDLLVDVFINLSNHYETEFLKGNGRQYIHGLSYAIIRPEFFPLRSVSLYKGPTRNVLITFGGEDMSKWTQRVVAWLEKNIFERLHITIVLGPLYEGQDSLMQVLRGPVRHIYTVTDYLHDIEVHMSCCDIAFCGSGTTILEFAYLGKPIIALPQHEMERKFLKMFEQEGYLCSMAESSIHNMELGECKRLFVDESLRNMVSEIGRKIVDGRGAVRIARIILKKAIGYHAQKQE